MVRTGLLATAAGVGGLALARGRGRGATRRVQGELEAMDPVTQAQEMAWLLAWREFGWDSEMSLSFALFRTYAVPSISVLLEATGEFTGRPRKRYDDTELVMAEMARHGVEQDGRGRDALRRMNAMHAAYDIDPDDTLYTLTTFICEPVRWIDRWGWRPMSDAEIDAITRMYVRIGEHMGLRDLPLDYAYYDRFNRDHEAARFAYHPSNRVIADHSIALFLDMYAPAALHPLGEVVVRAMMDQPLLDALGYEPAPVWVQRAVDRAMRARAVAQRELVPERRSDYPILERPRPTYPGGHDVARLGTFPGAAVRERSNAALHRLRGQRAGVVR